MIACIDLSKAFDRVNHQALLLRLQQLGLGGQVLNWIANYLSNRKQRVCVCVCVCVCVSVCVHDTLCDFQAVEQGVPKGSASPII